MKGLDHLLSWAFIAGRVILQIQLVIILGIPPLTSWYDLSRDWLLIPFLADFIGDALRDLLLLLAVGEDNTAVLSADIGALSVEGRSIMHAVEEFKELTVCDDGRIKCHLESFGICRKQKFEVSICLHSDAAMRHHRKTNFSKTYGQCHRCRQHGKMVMRSGHRSSRPWRPKGPFHYQSSCGIDVQLPRSSQLPQSRSEKTYCAIEIPKSGTESVY